MDSDYLLHRERIELMRAERATSSEARLAHQQLAEAYADRLRDTGATPAATR